MPMGYDISDVVYQIRYTRYDIRYQHLQPHLYLHPHLYPHPYLYCNVGWGGVGVWGGVVPGVPRVVPGVPWVVPGVPRVVPGVPRVVPPQYALGGMPVMFYQV